MTYHLCIDKTLQGQPYANRQGFPEISSSHPERVARATQTPPGQDMAIYEIEGQIRLEVSHKPKGLRSMARGLQWKESDRDRAERF